MTHASRRIAFLDIDGTIMAHGEVVAPSTVDAIRAARANGHLVLLCTGRAEGDIHPDVAAIGFDGAVTNGGAYAHVGGDLIVDRPMPRAATERLIELFEADGVGYFLQAHDAVYAGPEVLAGLDAFVRDREEERATDLARLGLPQERSAHVPTYLPLAEADLDAIAKTTFISRDAATLVQLQNELGDDFHVIPGSMPLPGGSNGEICLSGVTKGSAIELVLAHLGIDAADAIGIGDSWNDVEMFQVCGTAVAMAESPAELQALADHVTTGVLDDGVANALRTLGLI